ERRRRKEPEEGRSQKKYFYKYEMLPNTERNNSDATGFDMTGFYSRRKQEEAIKSIVSAINNVLTVLAVAISGRCYRI
ncbi:hypothetical protein, partial [Microcoleus sp. S13_D1]|uniref:hypothetical protein n=1 Tax=Microcoleus sp. S13_D1 TaxID=3055412 RepID=UPI002FD1D9EC